MSPTDHRGRSLPRRCRAALTPVLARRSRRTVARCSGSIVMVVLLLLAVFADVVAPHSPIEQFRDHFLTPPMWQQGGTAAFPLGTDDVGRDVLSRLIYGARLSLLIGISVVTLSLSCGIVLGSDRRLRRRPGRHRDHAADGHRAGVPQPAAGHRHRRHPRPRPVQRDDRGRRRHAAQLHAPDARRGAVGTGARLRHRDALRRRRARCT